MTASRRQAEAQYRQAHQDLDELAVQVADDELDPVTAQRLRAVYRAEMEEAELELAATGGVEDEKPGGARRWRRLALVGVTIVLAGLAVTVAGFVEMRAPGEPITGGLEGVARAGFEEGASFDPDDYSDEALEAVVAANADAPEIAGMRIALADRYFSRGDYQAAFPHYQAVLAADPAPSPTLVAAALTRLGWIVYQGNGEVDLAFGLFARALELSPDDPYIIYLTALVTWCGTGNVGGAKLLLEQVLASPTIDSEARAAVEADLAAAGEGETCR